MEYIHSHNLLSRFHQDVRFQQWQDNPEIILLLSLGSRKLSPMRAYVNQFDIVTVTLPSPPWRVLPPPQILTTRVATVKPSRFRCKATHLLLARLQWLKTRNWYGKYCGLIHSVSNESWFPFSWISGTRTAGWDWWKVWFDYLKSLVRLSSPVSISVDDSMLWFPFHWCTVVRHTCHTTVQSISLIRSIASRPNHSF